MATLRMCNRLFRYNCGAVRATRKCMSTQQQAARGSLLRPFLLGAVTVGSAATGYSLWNKYNAQTEPLTIPVTHAASQIPECQSSVISQVKKHAVYLTIHLKPNADKKKCAGVVANLQKHVDKVCPADLRDEDNEVLAGVGFSQDYYEKVFGKPKQNYKYPARKGKHGDMPSTGGDIFIHAKSDEMSKLFELTKEVLAQLPAGSVAKFEDIYSFVYQNGRDLSGFIDGTENPADDEHRTEVAVEKETGGSYVITQKWIHSTDVIDTNKDSTLESWIGRTREDSMELKKKSLSSHVARMTGGTNFEQKKKFEIVRQSMPFGNVCSDAGLFFIGYSASPKNLEYMLDRMVGREDGVDDDIMRLTKCVAGNYWFFPGTKDLKKIA